jgi:phosphotransferase system enzyme I (PtsI)
MGVILCGTGVSKGIVIGHAKVVGEKDLLLERTALNSEQIENEQKRFLSAIQIAKQDLHIALKKIPRNNASPISQFIDTYLPMLENPFLIDGTLEVIQTQRCNAEWALKIQGDHIRHLLPRIQDPIIQSRRDDIFHIIHKLQEILIHGPNDPNHIATLLGGENTILVVEVLSPADAILLRAHGGKGLVAAHGGPTSHAAIIARSIGLPTVVGTQQIMKHVKNNQPMIIDGDRGVVILDNDQRLQQYFAELESAERQHRWSLNSVINKTLSTRDGTSIELQINAELDSDIEQVNHFRADGVGLYRSEYLFLNQESLPSEEKQFDMYVTLVKGLHGKPINIRTIDITENKWFPTTDSNNKYATPTMGLRAIRYCLQHQEIFKSQLRAILRASAYGPVRILLPFLTTPTEVEQTKLIIEDIKHELIEKGLPFDNNIPLGGMIEIPASALIAESFAQHLDFLAIGTNDLIQFLMAIDRSDEQVNYLHNPSHPAVLKLIKMIVEAGHQHHIPVVMCGEMASEPRYIPILLGLGLRNFSISPSRFLEIKNTILESEIHSANAIAQLSVNPSSSHIAKS